MSRTRKGSLLGFGIALITAGLLLSMQSWVNTAFAAFTTQVDTPLELVVYPSTWTVSSRNSGTNMISVKGINGFTGSATITVSGLPSTIVDRYPSSSELQSGKGGYYCSSHCVSAANGDFPFSLPITNGEWNTLGTSMMAGSQVVTESKTVTITATANGQSVSKSFTLKLINDQPIPGPEGITYAAQANPDVVATVNDASWSSNGSEKYKLTGFAAGTSRTRQIDILNVSSEAKTVNILSNLSGSGLADVTSEITGSLSATSLSLGPNERKTIDVTVSPSNSTPNGVYEVIFGIQQADGSNRSGVGLALGITGGTTTTSSSTSTPTTSSTESSSSQPAASTPPASNAAAEAQAVVDSAQGEPAKDEEKAVPPKSFFKLSTNGLIFESKQGADPANASFEVIASGEKDSTTSYTISDDVDWLSVGGDPVALKAGEKHSHEIDITIPADMASGAHQAVVTVTDAKDPKKIEKLKVSLVVSLYDVVLPAAFTETRFVSALRPGFAYDWSTVFGNEGTAEAMIGILVPIPTDYELMDAQIFGPSGEILAKKSEVVAAVAHLKPGETRTLTLSLRIPPERVFGTETSDSPLIKPGQRLTNPRPFVFSTVSPATWDELKQSVTADELPGAAFKESLRTTGTVLRELKALPAGVRLQSLHELAANHRTLANEVSSALVYATLRDKIKTTGKRVSVLERLAPELANLRLIPPAHAQTQSGYGLFGPSLTATAQLGLQTAENVVSGFADGRQAAAFEGLVVGAAEKIIPLGLFKGSDTSSYGHDAEYQTGVVIGKVAGTVESTLIPGPGKGFFSKFDDAVTAGTVGGAVVKAGAGAGAAGAIGVFKEHYPDDVFGPMVTRRDKAITGLHPDPEGGFLATAQGSEGSWVDASEVAGIQRYIDGEVYYGDRMDPNLARQIYPDLGGASPTLAASFDPNHLTSSPAEGPINSTDPITYHIDFENLKAATAAATQVTITLPADEDFDLGSVQFLSSSHADHVKTSVDEAKRELRWEFTGISLPPNVTPPQGEGYAEFSIRPKADSVSGTELTAKASIVFDFNPAIETNTTTHLLDTVAPTPLIASAKAKGGGIQVAWSATDTEPGSGISEVRLIASPTDLSDGTEQVVTESPTRLKVKAGKTYLLRAMAIDKAGNVSPLTAGVTVNVSRPWLLYILLLLGAVGLAIWKRQIIWQKLRNRSSQISPNPSFLKEGNTGASPFAKGD